MTVGRVSRARRTDANQTELVAAFRKLGCSVLIINAEIDFLVGYGGISIAIEAKDGSKQPSARRLTLLEERFKDKWTGGYKLVENLEHVAETVALLRKWHGYVCAGTEKDMGN